MHILCRMCSMNHLFIPYTQSMSLSSLLALLIHSENKNIYFSRNQSLQSIAKRKKKHFDCIFSSLRTLFIVNWDWFRRLREQSNSEFESKQTLGRERESERERINTVSSQINSSPNCVDWAALIWTLPKDLLLWYIMHVLH